MIPQKTFFQSSDLEILSQKLEGKKVGDGYLCKCPCHDDKKQSLSLNESSAVGILFRCHAGCSQESVRDALSKLLGKQPSSNVVKAKFPKKRKEPDAIYQYRGFQKIRYNIAGGKEFHFRYQTVDGEWVYKKPKGIIGIYGIDKLERLAGKCPVIICEGEKDCDNLNEILGDSYCAITNDTGAAGWTANHANFLKNSEIIIAEDCDLAGEGRTEKIINVGKFGKLLGILKFTEEEVGKGGDVTDWLSRGHSPEELTNRLRQLVQVEIPGKPEMATYKDYIPFFQNFASQIGKDIISNDVMYFDVKENCWNPIENHLGSIRSIIRDENQFKQKIYYASAVDDHFNKWELSLEPKFLIDIPTWDGKDNIGSLCSHIRLNSKIDVSELCFMALTKEWMANVFRKLKDPSMKTSPSREFILILTGKEYIGKDYWIDSLLCGLGQFFNEMTILNNERDNLMQLHLGLVLYIGEFDRTSKLESSFLKSIVTKPHTTLRASHARKQKRRLSRTNFIASCNPNDILRDHSANTRYAIFELDEIKRDYKKDLNFSLQCLAQAKHLAETGYVAPADLWQEMSQYIKDRTPEDPNKEIAEIYEESVKKWLNQIFVTDPETATEIRDNGWAKSSQLNEVFLDVAKKTYGSLRRVKAALVALNYGKRTPESRGFLLTKN